MQERLIETVARLGGYAPSEVRVELRTPLDHQSNRLYDAWAGDRHLLGKEYLKPDEFSTAPLHEHRSLELLAQFDVAPQPVGVEFEHGPDVGPIVVYEYLWIGSGQWSHPTGRATPTPGMLSNLAGRPRSLTGRLTVLTFPSILSRVLVRWEPMSTTQEALSDLEAVARELEDRGEADLAARVARSAAALKPGADEQAGALTTGQAAKELGIRSVNTIKQWAHSGKLRGFRLGGRMFITAESVRAMKDSALLDRQRAFEREIDEALAPFGDDGDDLPTTLTTAGRRPWESDAPARA